MKPIYTKSYSSHRRKGKGRWKFVFFIIILIHLLIGGYFLFKPDRGPKKLNSPQPMDPIGTTDGIPAPLPPTAPPAKTTALIDDARGLLNAGQLADAQALLSRVVEETTDQEAIKLLGDVNMRLLKSAIITDNKTYYAIESGDYLQKIAGKYSTTVELIKVMNGLKNDTIRRGDRLIVFTGSFSLRVSKTRNELDLLNNGKLFKRYKVGTGKFGKTPAVEFNIVDKIIEPPWTRPADNRQIEYGDPENVLGTRWMAMKSADHPELTGFGIHGTSERDSIGKQSSAGCVRMLNEDVEELFDLIPRNTKVIITD